MDYRTVFEIRNIAATDEFPFLLLPIAGVTFLILGLAAFLYRKRRKEPRGNLRNVKLTMCIGAFFLATTPTMLSEHTRNEGLAEQFRLGNFETIEGVVHVIREQSKHGHTPGDLIEIDSKQFEIDHFGGTIGYEATISNGGHLKSGIIARVSFVGDDIVRVELKEANVE